MWCKIRVPLLAAVIMHSRVASTFIAVHKMISCFEIVELFLDGIAPRQSKGQAHTTNSNAIGSGKATLRLRSKGPATVEMEVEIVHE